MRGDLLDPGEKCPRNGRVRREVHLLNEGWETVVEQNLQLKWSEFISKYLFSKKLGRSTIRAWSEGELLEGASAAIASYCAAIISNADIYVYTSWNEEAKEVYSATNLST